MSPSSGASSNSANRHARHKRRILNGHPLLSIIASIIWTIGCILLVQLLLAFIFRFLVQTFDLRVSIAQTIYSVLTYIIAGAIIIFVPPRFSKLKRAHDVSKTPSTTTPMRTTKPLGSIRSELGLIGWPTWTDLGLAPIGFIIYTLAAAVFNGLFTFLPWYNATETQNLGFSQFAVGFDRVLAFFTLAIAAPIAEELIFRGYLYAKLKKNALRLNRTTTSQSGARTTSHKTELVAIIVASLLTSLVFALMHGQWNVGVNVFVMSLVLCAMREITGTVYAGIIMHMIKNTVAFLLVFIVGFGF